MQILFAPINAGMPTDALHCTGHVPMELPSACKCYSAMQGETKPHCISTYGMKLEPALGISQMHGIDYISDTALLFIRVVYGDINPKDNEGMTPLHFAALFGRAKHISLLNEGEFP